MSQTLATPRKKPRQARAIATVEAILQASTRILQRDGLDKLNTNHIAEVAGVSVGTLYQYFPSKDAILTQLIRQKRQNLRERLKTALVQSADQPVENRLDQLLRVTIEHQARWPMVGRTLDYAEAFLPMAAESAAFKSDLVQIIASLLAQFEVPKPRIVARDLIFALNGLIEGAFASDQPDEADILTRAQILVHGYIAAAKARI